MAKAPGEKRVSIAKTQWLDVPTKRPPLTPRRRVTSETSHVDGLRELHLECGHRIMTRDHAVVEETPCLMCVGDV